MLNQVVLVGRITSIPEEEKKDKIIIAVPRAYKNADGEYENDFITIQLFKSLSENAFEYLTTGDLVGVKGRLQTKDDKVIVCAEKLTFLSSKREDGEQNFCSLFFIGGIMKKYIIDSLIEKLEYLKDENRRFYGCDLSYELWESENIDGTITYNSYQAKEFIKKYYDDIGEVWEELNFNFDQDYLSKFNMFDNPEKFMLLVVMEVSSYLLGKCQLIDKYWNDETILTNYKIEKLIKQLKEINDGGEIYA